LRFSVLGTLTMRAGAPVSPGPPKQRLTLALLLAAANTPVSTDALTDGVWPDEPPRTARKNLQVYVCNLRRLLDDTLGAGDRLTHDYAGYRIEVGVEELDSRYFTVLADSGRAARQAGAHTAASRRFRQALQLWRGTPFTGLHEAPALAAAAARLTNRYLEVLEDWAETELDLGRHPEVLERIADLIDRHPDRERLRVAQIRALVQAGRKTAALAVYEEVRRRLAAEYGLAPSPPLEALYRSILADRPGPVAAPPAGDAGPALPPDVPDFVGRTDELARLAEAVRDGDRLVVLTGPAGVGKTALATRFADVATRDFADGRFLIRMRHRDGAPRTTGEILTELATAGGLTGRLTGHHDHDLRVWTDFLGRQRILLILDDAPHEAAVRPFLTSAGDSTVLVTARSRLAGLAAARRLDVRCLTAAEAYELLSLVAGADRLAAEPAAAYAVVAATGMLPLAVRVAGLKLAALRHLPVRQYVARLHSAAVLDELVAGDVTVRPRLAETWADLSASHRADLVRLASLATPVFQLPDAAATLGGTPDQTLRRVESLIDVGALLSPGDEVAAHVVRYEMPALLWAYAREVGVGG
jgi:DNA-binding SARP family transcriptional activator